MAIYFFTVATGFSIISFHAKAILMQAQVNILCRSSFHILWHSSSKIYNLKVWLWLDLIPLLGT